MYLSPNGVPHSPVVSVVQSGIWPFVTRGAAVSTVPKIEDRFKWDTNLRKVHSCTLKIAPFESRLNWESGVSPGSTRSNFQLVAVSRGVHYMFSRLQERHNPGKMRGYIVVDVFFCLGRPFALNYKWNDWNCTAAIITTLCTHLCIRGRSQRHTAAPGSGRSDQNRIDRCHLQSNKTTQGHSQGIYVWWDLVLGEQGSEGGLRRVAHCWLYTTKSKFARGIRFTHCICLATQLHNSSCACVETTFVHCTKKKWKLALSVGSGPEQGDFWGGNKNSPYSVKSCDIPRSLYIPFHLIQRRLILTLRLFVRKIYVGNNLSLVLQR